MTAAPGIPNPRRRRAVPDDLGGRAAVVAGIGKFVEPAPCPFTASHLSLSAPRGAGRSPERAGSHPAAFSPTRHASGSAQRKKAAARELGSSPYRFRRAPAQKGAHPTPLVSSPDMPDRTLPCRERILERGVAGFSKKAASMGFRLPVKPVREAPRRLGKPHRATGPWSFSARRRSKRFGRPRSQGGRSGPRRPCRR